MSPTRPAPAAAPRRLPVALSIAGSDSGGGAGIQADLKTFSALRVFGTTALTCVTAQNPDGVAGVQAIEPEMLTRQIRAVLEGFPVAAAKTGMLYSAEIVAAVSEALRAAPGLPLVVDPVMVATSGARLLREDAVERLCRDLLPRATLITPNLPEAEALLGESIESVGQMETAARRLSQRFAAACVVKGGHLATGPGGGGERVVDVLCTGRRVYRFEIPRVAAAQTHGTGCTFSAAVTAWLARGRSLHGAVERAQRFVYQALVHAPQVGRHRPLGIGLFR